MSTEDPTDRAPEANGTTVGQRVAAIRQRVTAAMAWVAEHRAKAAMLGCAVAVSVGGVVVLWLTLAAHDSGQPLDFTLDDALAALDHGAYGEAARMAELLRDSKDYPVDELGGPVFVLGAVEAYTARDMGPTESRRRYLLAAGYLEEARDRGFPPGRKAEGLFLLGESLYHSGQIPACRSALKEALEVDRSRRAEIYDLLAAACLADATPKLKEALEYNTRYLADRLLPQAERHRALVRQARILLRMGKLAECRDALAQVPADSQSHAAAVVVEGLLLMREAAELAAAKEPSPDSRRRCDELYRRAIKTLRTAQSRDTLGAQATRKSRYLIGVCFARLEDYPAALAQFERVRATYADSDEAIAASFQEAEIARKTGRDGPALANYRRVLRMVIRPEQFHNEWFTLEELREGMLGAYRGYMKEGKFGVALQMVQDFYPLFPKVETTLWKAQTLQKWGDTLMAQAKDLPKEQADAVRRQARTQLRRAGRAWEDLAGLETVTRRYTDHLWTSAEDYLAGHAYEDTVRVLREYLKNETRYRHSRALASLGEALLALGRVDEALAAFTDCIDFHPRDAGAFRARLLASRAYLEKGDLAKARDLLEENLNGVLSPASTEWRESLFALGQLWYVEGNYEKAIARLSEAVGRYPDAPEALEARYLTAACYRRRAEALQKEADTSPVRYVRMEKERQVRELLHSALDEYQQVRDLLNRQQQSHPLDAHQKAILRNTWFAVGGVQFDLGLYAEAIQTYTTATYRYQGDPAVLLAYLQMACAQERLAQPAAARNTLKQAKIALGRIRADAPFEKVTPFGRAEWEQLLNKKLGIVEESG